MGCIKSKPAYIENVAGGEKDYQERFLETKTLGEGEFGVVKLVHDVRAKDLIQAKPLAVKYLRKGFTFKDNTLYSPLKKEMLQGEVEILRQLNGEVREIIDGHAVSLSMNSHCIFITLSILTICHLQHISVLQSKTRECLRKSIHDIHDHRVLRRRRNDAIHLKSLSG